MLMKTVLVACALVCVVYSRPQSRNDPRQSGILKYDYDNNGFGRYSFNVDTSDGFHHDQTGEERDVGTENEHPSVYGHYSYVGADGGNYYVEYVADKNGFQPAGKHLPKSAGVSRVGQLGIPSAAIKSLAGNGLG
nr:endocuticle structural protein SgAbd-6-like [Leptinotarsa decemlineata]